MVGFCFQNICPDIFAGETGAWSRYVMNHSAAPNSLPTRKAILARQISAPKSRGLVSHRVQETLVPVEGNLGVVNSSAEYSRLFQKRVETEKIPASPANFRAGYGQIFPEKSPASAHPNEQRIEDRSWLYVKMNVKF